MGRQCRTPPIAHRKRTELLCGSHDNDDRLLAKQM
jgi:hypothetical protein